MNKEQWCSLSRGDRGREIAKSFRGAVFSTDGVDFPILSDLFGLWACRIEVERRESGWVFKPGLGLRVIGLESDGVGYADRDSAACAAISKLSQLLYRTVENPEYPFDQKVREKALVEAADADGCFYDAELPISHLEKVE